MKINRLALTALPLILLTSFATSSHGNEFNGRIESVGVRGGWDAENDVSLTQIGVFANSPALKSWSFGERAELTLNLLGSIGHLSGEGDDAVFVVLAPQLTLGFADWPVDLSLSSGPAYYSRDDFGDYDLGNNFEFVSKIGFDFSLSDTWSIGYRFQHTSNGGIDSDDNPGLDMHLLAAAYRF